MSSTPTSQRQRKTGILMRCSGQPVLGVLSVKEKKTFEKVNMHWPVNNKDPPVEATLLLLKQEEEQGHWCTGMGSYCYYPWNILKSRKRNCKYARLRLFICIYLYLNHSLLGQIQLQSFLYHDYYKFFFFLASLIQTCKWYNYLS